LQIPNWKPKTMKTGTKFKFIWGERHQERKASMSGVWIIYVTT